MNTATHPAPTGAFNTRQLWAAVSVLGVAVVALGASLVYLETRPLDGHTAAATLVAPALIDDPAADMAASALPVTTVGPDEAILPAPAPAPAPAKATPAKPAALQKPETPAASVARPAAATPLPVPPAAIIAPAAIVTGTVPNAPMLITDAGPIASQPISKLPTAQPQAKVYSTGRN